MDLALWPVKLNGSILPAYAHINNIRKKSPENWIETSSHRVWTIGFWLPEKTNEIREME